MSAGQFGAITFRADRYLAKSIKRNTTSEWASHKILNAMPISQKTGLELATLSLDLTFNSRHTMKFEDAMTVLEGYVISGEYFPLIIGGTLVGGCQYPNYILKKVSGDYNITDNKGLSLASSAQVEFEQYRPTITPSNGGLLGNIGGMLGGVGSALGSALGGISGLGGAISGLTGGLTSALGGITGALGGISGVVSSTLGNISTIAGIASSIPGVGSAISGLTGTINQLVAATGVNGVIGQINAILGVSGTSVNGIDGGSLTPSLDPMANMTSPAVANAVSLAHGGGVSASSGSSSANSWSSPANTSGGFGINPGSQPLGSDATGGEF